MLGFRILTEVTKITVLKMPFGLMFSVLVSSTVMAITNGESLPSEEFRQTVAITFKADESSKLAEIFCSGTLIGPKIIISAGHCIQLGAKHFSMSTDEFSKHLWIYVGDSPSEGQIPLIEPNFKVSSVKWVNDVRRSPSDISLLTVSEGVDLNAFKITPAAIVPYEKLKRSAQMTTVGYGVLNNGLVKGLKRKFTAALTSRIGGNFTTGTIGIKSATACHGDSGGSAYLRDGSGKIFFAGITLTLRNEDTCGIDGTSYQGFTQKVLNWIDQARR